MQTSGAGEIACAGRLDRRMHVAQRDRQQAGGDSLPRHLDGPGIGARVARSDIDLVRDLIDLRPSFTRRAWMRGWMLGPIAIDGPPSMADRFVLSDALLRPEPHIDRQRRCQEPHRRH